MRIYKALTRRRWVLLLALLLVLPAIPARAVPCDDYRLDADALGTRNIEVVLATDEAWRQTYGDEEQARARQLLDDTNRILEPAGLVLSVANFQSWSSVDHAQTMSRMLSHLDSSVPAQPSQLVIGLTGRQISRVDGIAHVDHIHVVARLHPGNPHLDGLVVAHEIGSCFPTPRADCLPVRRRSPNC